MERAVVKLFQLYSDRGIQFRDREELFLTQGGSDPCGDVSHSGGIGKKINRIVEVEALYVAIAVSETMGVYLLDALLKMLGRIPDSPEILRTMETAFSHIILMFLYCVLIRRLWKKTDLRTKEQYRLYVILFVYSIVNILFISENPILNCLLSEKRKEAEMLGVSFKVENITVDLSFMKAIDITTLFGNVIDSVVAAAAVCTGNKYVKLSVEALNEMVAVRAENTVSREIPIKHGEMPEKGIGILNIERCVETFHGSMIYSCEKYMLRCDIILNRIDVS